MNGNRQIGERSARSLEKKLKLEKFSLDNCPLQSNINPDFESITEWDDSTPLDDDEAEIPFYKDIAFACGHGAVNDEVTHETRKLRMGKRTLSNLGVMSENAFAVTARDDSMTPYVQDGDTIYIDKGRKEIKDGRILRFALVSCAYVSVCIDCLMAVCVSSAIILMSSQNKSPPSSKSAMVSLKCLAGCGVSAVLSGGRVVGKMVEY